MINESFCFLMLLFTHYLSGQGSCVVVVAASVVAGGAAAAAVVASAAAPDGPPPPPPPTWHPSSSLPSAHSSVPSQRHQ